MTIMDSKGIAWVGNIYQKLEALCLEIEDNVYEDTVKYVENQVQTVGASVKKFYSDVVQDLLPPSEMDPVKVAASDLPSKQYADTRIYKKPKVSIKEEAVKADVKKKSEDSNVIANVIKHGGHASSMDGLRCVNRMPPSSGHLVKVASPDFYLGQKDDGNICKKSNVGVKENLNKEDQHPSEIFDAINPDENNKAGCEHIDVISCSGSNEKVGCESKEEDKEGRTRKDIADASNCADGASVELRSFDIKSSPSTCVIPTESNDMSPQNRASPMENSANEDTHHSDMLDANFGSLDGWNIDPLEINDVIDYGMETNEVIDNDKVKLEETCVVVDGGQLCFVPHKEAKQKSYKKKIRDAFSSKLRSARKHEYEQLAAQYKDIDAGSNQGSAKNLMTTLTISEPRKLQSHELCESEWELL